MPITNFEEITETLTEGELMMLPYVKMGFEKFTTKENAIKSDSLCEIINHLYIMENGFVGDFVPMNGVRLRKFVNYLRKNSILPVIGVKNGYFVNYQQEELENQIKSLTERANGILVAAEGLKRFLI